MEICDAAPYTETTKAERMKKMKNFEAAAVFANANPQNLCMEKPAGLLLTVAKSEICIPEKRVILAGEMTEQEALFLKPIIQNQGGLIV